MLPSDPGVASTAPRPACQTRAPKMPEACSAARSPVAGRSPATHRSPPLACAACSRRTPQQPWLALSASRPRCRAARWDRAGCLATRMLSLLPSLLGGASIFPYAQRDLGAAPLRRARSMAPRAPARSRCPGPPDGIACFPRSTAGEQRPHRSPSTPRRSAFVEATGSAPRDRWGLHRRCSRSLFIQHSLTPPRAGP